MTDDAVLSGQHQQSIEKVSPPKLVNNRRPTPAERLKELRSKLEEARELNLQAVEDEVKSRITNNDDNTLKRPRTKQIESHVEEDYEKILANDKQVKNEGRQVIYGKTGANLEEKDRDKVRGMMTELETKRKKRRKVRTFDEDRSEINFVNEGNRRFNERLNKHFDQFEEVREIKESLERGTA